MNLFLPSWWASRELYVRHRRIRHAHSQINHAAILRCRWLSIKIATTTPTSSPGRGKTAADRSTRGRKTFLSSLREFLSNAPCISHSTYTRRVFNPFLFLPPWSIDWLYAILEHLSQIRHDSVCHAAPILHVEASTVTFVPSFHIRNEGKPVRTRNRHSPNLKLSNVRNFPIDYRVA